LCGSGKGQADRQKPLLKGLPTKVALKTIPHPEGIHPGLENPASMFARDQVLIRLHMSTVTLKH
jgi:hypothetical protein